jgi:chloramphenicol O-acetyltransferase
VVSELEKPLQVVPSTPQEFSGDLYLSPFVKSIAQQENISEAELKSIKGTGLEGRITKEDILAFVKNRNTSTQVTAPVQVTAQLLQLLNSPVQVAEGDEIIPMDRVRKLIADAMVNSKKTAPHVTSFIESDVTNVVKWRTKHKDAFEKREGQKLTFMPIFVKAVVKAIQDFPLINISVDGDKIIKKKNINIGMATALPDGNLIVPVIKNADQLSLSGLAKAINDLAYRARNKKLKPEDTQGATYTISNIGFRKFNGNTYYSTATSCYFGNWRYCKETCSFRNQRRRCNCCSSKNVHEPFLRPQSCRWKFGRNVPKTRSRLSRKLGLRHRNLKKSEVGRQKSSFKIYKKRPSKNFSKVFCSHFRFHYSLF